MGDREGTHLADGPAEGGAAALSAPRGAPGAGSDPDRDQTRIGNSTYIQAKTSQPEHHDDDGHADEQGEVRAPAAGRERVADGRLFGGVPNARLVIARRSRQDEVHRVADDVHRPGRDVVRRARSRSCCSGSSTSRRRRACSRRG